MTKNDTDFATWLDILCLNVLDQAGVDLRDDASVREDYDAGRDVFDVIDEIVSEYGGER